MRTRTTIAVLALVLTLAGVGQAAFDFDAWQRKRAEILKDAERLRKAYAECAADEMPPAEDVVVPLESNPDGSIRLSITAKKAKYFLSKGLVWAEGVSLRKYDRDGALDSQIDAANCVVDRYSKSGWAEGHAKVTHGKTTFEGAGVYFSSSNGYVRVTAGSDLISRDLSGGLKP